MRLEEMNDLDPSSWREYDNILTSAAWFSPNEVKPIPNVPGLAKPSTDFHGCFVPYIPWYAMVRYTKRGEVVWDCFAGSGTTIDVAEALGRVCIANDVNPQRSDIVQADSTTYDPGQNVQLIILHPPYYNIIPYDGDERLSGAKSVDAFLDGFDAVVDNVTRRLDKDRMLVLVCGNIYLDSEELTLGVWCKDIIRAYGFRLRSHIVKGYGETKDKSSTGKSANLTRYRALKFGFNEFYGDNVFVLQKHPSKVTTV